MKTTTLIDLPLESPEEINVVNETPRGSRNKLKYDVDTGLFLLKKVLPAEAVFPYDFGFMPSTAGETISGVLHEHSWNAVSMARPLLANPRMPEYLRKGYPLKFPCTYCNKCLVSIESKISYN